MSQYFIIYRDIYKDPGFSRPEVTYIVSNNISEAIEEFEQQESIDSSFIISITKTEVKTSE